MAGTSTGGMIRAANRHGWRDVDLPPVVHTMTSRFGETLQARVVRPGERFGVDGFLTTLEGPLVEVRVVNRLDQAFGFPGRTVALFDVETVGAESAACWQLLHQAMPYSIEPDAWRSLLAAVDDATAPHPPDQGPGPVPPHPR
jgi:hypothetical protein